MINDDAADDMELIAERAENLALGYNILKADFPDVWVETDALIMDQIVKLVPTLAKMLRDRAGAVRTLQLEPILGVIPLEGDPENGPT